MKIALVTSSFLPTIGGMEYVVHYLAHQWYVQGHEVRVINNTTDEATHAMGEYTVRKFPLLRGTAKFGFHPFPIGWHAVRGLKRLLDEFQPDFISAHLAYPTAYWLSRISPMPKYIVTCHGGDITKFDWGLRKKYKCEKLIARGLKSAAGVIAISTFARKLIEELGVDSSRILDIPTGANTEKFKKKSSIDFRDKIGISKEAIVVLSVGGNHPRKGFETGLRAFAKYNARVPDTRYVIIGKGTHRLRPLAMELGVENKVVTCEGLPDEDVVAAYQQADIYFSPSVWEMFAQVVVEAMAVGLPQVVTNISGSQDVIQSGYNGFVVEPNQPDEMAEALYKLAVDKELRTRMGAINLEKSKSFGWDDISKEYLEKSKAIWNDKNNK